jgi:hypothetical protein
MVISRINLSTQFSGCHAIEKLHPRQNKMRVTISFEAVFLQ